MSFLEERGEAGGCDVAAFGGDHFVVDLDEERADEADHRCFVGEDPDDVGASFEFAVQTFDRVVRPDLSFYGSSRAASSIMAR